MEDSNIAELQSWFIIRILKSKLTDLGVRNRVTGDRSWQIWSSIFHHELLNSEHQAKCLRLACVPSRFTSPTWYTLNTSHLFRKEPESQIERKRALGGTISISKPHVAKQESCCKCSPSFLKAARWPSVVTRY